jgi:GNAT superfamily N-acetyltransferase
MPPLTVRLATAADGAVLTALAARLATFPLPAWRQPSDIADADAGAMIAAVAAAAADNQVFVAERAGTVVGCLHLVVTTDFFGLRHGHVSVLATTAAAEGTGVARELMRHAEEWTRARGLELLTLNMFARNERARRFYERAGFEPEMVKYSKEVNSQFPTSNS